MKLYFSPGACSLSPHIVFREAGLDVQLEQVHLGSKKTKSGGDFWQTNPKGYVPALELDDGKVLTEGPAIVQLLADKKPESKLAPANGTFERYQLQEWLTFIGTELHKSYSPLFNPKASDDWKAASKEKIVSRLDLIEKGLGSKSYLMGEDFTVADAYFFVMLTWKKAADLDLAKWPKIQAYFERVNARPAVKAALEAEKAARASA